MMGGVRPRTLVYKDLESRPFLPHVLRRQSKLDEREEEEKEEEEEEENEPEFKLERYGMYFRHYSKM